MAGLRRHWGLTLLCIVSVFALGRVMIEPMPGHYRIFVSAARELLAGRNPYGTNYGTGIGNYFYSIFCAWSVFAPLSFLPEKVGVLFYVVGAWALFVTATRRLAQRLAWSMERIQLFWFLIAAQVFSAILATKLELLMVGILFWAFEAWLDENASRRRLTIATVLLAAILNWKYQPLPILALLAVACVLAGRRLREWPLLIVAVAAMGLAPYAVYPGAELARWNAVWNSTFENFIRTAFLNFENLFASYYFATGNAVSLETSQWVTAGVGAVLSLVLATALWRQPRGSRWPQGALLALAWGTAFICAFSPLGQNNAMILYAPLLWVTLGAARLTRIWKTLLGGTWFLMTWSYSDLVIWAGLGWVRDLQIKPLVCVALAVAVGIRMRHLQTPVPKVRSFGS